MENIIPYSSSLYFQNLVSGKFLFGFLFLFLLFWGGSFILFYFGNRWHRSMQYLRISGAVSVLLLLLTNSYSEVLQLSPCLGLGSNSETSGLEVRVFKTQKSRSKSGLNVSHDSNIGLILKYSLSIITVLDLRLDSASLESMSLDQQKQVSV